MAFLGCSRGLGREVAREFLQRNLCDRALLVARGKAHLESLQEEWGGIAQSIPMDFSKSDSVENLEGYLQSQSVGRFFYFAAGGPFGNFSEKEWKDHQWALQVSFLTPARLLHWGLKNTSGQLKQMVFVGSQIADSKPDPMASSYASAKHGLKGLITSVQAEKPDVDVRLFRPGYMDTDMLPKNARPRLSGEPILDPQFLAQRFVDWAMDPEAPLIWEG